MFDDEDELFGPVSVGWLEPLLSFRDVGFWAMAETRRLSPNPDMKGCKSSSRRIFDDFMFPCTCFRGLHSWIWAKPLTVPCAIFNLEAHDNGEFVGPPTSYNQTRRKISNNQCFITGLSKKLDVRLI